MPQKIFLTIITVSVLMTDATQVLAQDAQQKALARAQYMLRQVNAEKAQLQQELMKLKEANKSLESELDQTKKTAKKKEGKLKETLAGWKESHQNLKERLSNTLNMLADSNQQVDFLTDNLNKQTTNFQLCYDNNKKLYDVGMELISSYENKGAWDVIAQREPFTKIKQVEIENFVQDHQYQIEDLNLGMNEYLIEQVNY